MSNEAAPANAIDVEPTAEIIDSMAKVFEERANELRRIAESMRSKGELNYASDALQVVQNTIGHLRMDLLVARPLRTLGVR
ncbi:hypothetical protein ACI2KR_06530 [Pseudomonas luteola]